MIQRSVNRVVDGAIRLGAAASLALKPKYMVSSAREDSPKINSRRLVDDPSAAVKRQNDAAPDGVFLDNGKLAAELDRPDLIDRVSVPCSAQDLRPRPNHVS